MQVLTTYDKNLPSTLTNKIYALYNIILENPTQVRFL